MTHIEQAIRDSQSADWLGIDLPSDSYFHWSEKRYADNYKKAVHASIFLDLAFWQSLGKARGWEDPMKECGCCRKIKAYCRCANFEMYQEWHKRWHLFIRHLAEGKDAESFFKDL